MVPIGPGNCGGQHSATASDATLDGADGHVEDRGDLGIVQVSNITQHHWDPKVLGERSERGIDLFAIAELFDAFTSGRVSAVMQVVFAPVVLVVSTSDQGPSSSPTEFIQAGVGGDAIGPRAERRTAVETGETTHHCDHGFLCCIGSVGLVAGDSPADAEHAVVVPSEELVERTAVATLRCADKCSIVERHSHVAKRSAPRS